MAEKKSEETAPAATPVDAHSAPPAIRPESTAVSLSKGETPSAAVTAAMAPMDVPKVGYATSAWHGLDNFECKTCVLATLEEDEMRAHIATNHPQVTAAASKK